MASFTWVFYEEVLLSPAFMSVVAQKRCTASDMVAGEIGMG